MRKPLTLPVRFTAMGESVQTTTRDVNETGAFVRCVEPPAPGERVMLELQLPDGGSATVGAEVESVDVAAGESGFWATFVDQEPSLAERIRYALDRADELASVEPVAPAEVPKTNPGIGRNRRVGQRFLDRLVVKLGGRGLEPGVFALNVSASGLYVLTPNPPPLDSVLELSLELPDKKGPVRVLGLVMRRMLPEDCKKPGDVPGAGLVFMGGDDEFRTRYDAYLAALGKKPAPPGGH